MKSLDDIQDMLDMLPSAEWRFDKVREDALTYTGALRTTEGQNVIEPSAESASMVIGLKASIDFLEVAPEIVQQLLNKIDDLEAEKNQPPQKTTLHVENVSEDEDVADVPKPTALTIEPSKPARAPK